MTSIGSVAAPPGVSMTPLLVTGGLLVLAVLAIGGVHPLVLAGVLAMLPISLAWLWSCRRAQVAATPGLWGMDGPAARWAMVLALPALAGVMMATRVQGLGLKALLAAVVLGVALCAAVLAAVRANPAAQALGALVACVVSAAFAYAAVVGLDVALDRSAPGIETTRVIELNGSGGRGGGSWHVGLASPSGERDYVVTPSVYRRLGAGGPACILHHPGALGLAWFEVAGCAVPSPAFRPAAGRSGRR